jgi:hypothetical protein
MSWYYADNNERRGPIEDAAFQSLVAAGTIKPETLVWREGMPEWTAYGKVAAAAPAAVAAAAFPAGAAGAPVDSSARACSQCGKLFPADEMIFLAGRSICASCKPLVVQHMIEGTDTGGGAPFDSAQFLADLRARGGYEIPIGNVLSRAWATVTGNFWPCVGVTLLAYFVMVVSQQIPCVGILAPFLVTGPIFGGLYLYFLKQLRGQEASVGDAFSGFNKPHFGRLALTGTVQTLIVGVVMAVLIGPAVALNWSALQSRSDAPPYGFIAWCLVAAVPIFYLTISWMFSYALVIDKRMEFWPAMELSRKVVNMNLWGWVLMLLVYMLLSIAGMIALCVGVFVVLPVTLCGLMVIYEDIFSQRSTPTA